MTKRQVFFSFHYRRDIWRVNMIAHIGVVEGQPVVSANEWQSVKSHGDAAIKKWINEHMDYRSCIIVLIGTETLDRPWVKYEIRRAAELNKPIFGIRINNLENKDGSTDSPGLQDTDFPVYTLHGDSKQAYAEVSQNIGDWIETAIHNN